MCCCSYFKDSFRHHRVKRCPSPPCAAAPAAECKGSGSECTTEKAETTTEGLLSPRAVQAAAAAAGVAGAAAVAAPMPPMAVPGSAPLGVAAPGTALGGLLPLGTSPAVIAGLALVPAGLAAVAVFPPTPLQRVPALSVIFSEAPTVIRYILKTFTMVR